MSLPTVVKVGIGWTVTAAVGIYCFVISKRNIDAKRYENMKARQRARDATIVE